jgi:o-succinylbenzoate synthase
MLHLHEPIWIHRYTLRLRQAANARSTRREVTGALVKIGAGYGCLQPWPELGDLPLDTQLRLLEKGAFTSHLERLRVCCRLDGTARRREHSEWDEFTSPPSHALDPEPGPLIKVKCGPDIKQTLTRLRELAPARLRLDFNATLTVEAFSDFVRQLDDATAERIDFIEDPFHADQYWWDKIQRNIPFDLAADREPVRARVRIIKPACDEAKPRAIRTVFTSYMDHPLGQYFAAREAAAYYASCPHQAEVCGLASHTIFEPDSDPFLARISTDAERRLLSPGGTGLGFDDLLAALPWEQIVSPH